MLKDRSVGRLGLSFFIYKYHQAVSIAFPPRGVNLEATNDGFSYSDNVHLYDLLPIEDRILQRWLNKGFH